MDSVELAAKFCHKEDPPCAACIATAFGVQREIAEEYKGVPVNDKLKEAFKAIRHNFHARERLKNLITLLQEEKGYDPKTIWGALIDEMKGIENVLLEAGAGGQPPLEPQGRPFYKEDFMGVKCSCPDVNCKDHGTFIHARCHIGYPTWAEFSPREGVLIIRCSVCDETVARIAVAPRDSQFLMKDSDS